MFADAENVNVSEPWLTTATVQVTAQCAYPATVVSHVHFEFASHAAAPVSAEHVDQSPASPHVD